MTLNEENHLRPIYLFNTARKYLYIRGSIIKNLV